VIDIHIHLLHGLDDGPENLDESLELARACVAAGTTMAVATPHIRDDYPFPLEAIDVRVRELRRALAEDNIPLVVLPGGEVALDKSSDLTDAELVTVALARGPYILVESPYGEATDFLETALYELQLRGFHPVLAHPERSPSFQAERERLAVLVERGVLASITAASMTGRFGRTVRAAAREMLAADLVHNVASDAHSARDRGPGMMEGFEALDIDLPGLRGSAAWYTQEVPDALLSRQRIPERHGVKRKRRWRRHP
jgi:protein-tyrosine phosphatase